MPPSRVQACIKRTQIASYDVRAVCSSRWPSSPTPPAPSNISWRRSKKRPWRPRAARTTCLIDRSAIDRIGKSKLVYYLILAGSGAGSCAALSRPRIYHSRPRARLDQSPLWYYVVTVPRRHRRDECSTLRHPRKFVGTDSYAPGKGGEDAPSSRASPTCLVVVRATVDTPSTNFVRKTTFALLNMPSLSETTMNCDALKWARSMTPMFCVWDRSRAASTSSRDIHRRRLEEEHGQD